MKRKQNVTSSHVFVHGPDKNYRTFLCYAELVHSLESNALRLNAADDNYT